MGDFGTFFGGFWDFFWDFREDVRRFFEVRTPCWLLTIVIFTCHFYHGTIGNETLTPLLERLLQHGRFLAVDMYGAAVVGCRCVRIGEKFRQSLECHVDLGHRRCVVNGSDFPFVISSQRSRGQQVEERYFRRGIRQNHGTFDLTTAG